MTIFAKLTYSPSLPPIGACSIIQLAGDRCTDYNYGKNKETKEGEKDGIKHRVWAKEGEEGEKNNKKDGEEQQR